MASVADMRGGSPFAPRDGRSTSPTSDIASSEALRLRELLLYISSLTDTGGYPGSDIDDASSYEPVAARLSTDPVLNALAQLSVHRLRCERAFISLVDDAHQYIMAEATREISLFDALDHPCDQGLCIGARPIDLVSGVCAGTMPAFLSTTGEEPYLQTDNIYADCNRYIIKDFALEPKYRDRPYVTGFPFMRFYAEVPIKTLSGYVIGSLAVVDNKPRRELREHEFRILVELSMAIMAHIEKVKVEQDHVQARLLLKGISTFLDPKPIETVVTPDQKVSTQNTGDRIDTRQKVKESSDRNIFRSTPVARNKAQFIPSTDLNSASFDHRPKDEMSFSISTVSAQEPGLESKLPPLRHEFSSRFTKDTSQIRAETHVEGPDGPYSTSSKLKSEDATKMHFSRAADVLRMALKLEGLAFLDAIPHGFDSHHDTDSSLTTLSGGLPARTEMVYRDIKRASATLPGTRQEGFRSARDHFRFAPSLGICATNDALRNLHQFSRNGFLLPEVVLQSLLRHYPRGHVFDFKQPPPASQEEQDTFARSSVGDGLGKTLLTQDAVFEAIRDLIPDIYSAIFVPLWSATRQSWFSGAFGWATRNRRLLQRDDLAYLSVFGNSVMAEVARLELYESDRAKADFISSISHELRSPLHGILGTTELMREGASSAAANEMIDMVENCGQTLLDTVDHILDYAKIRTSTDAGSPFAKHNQQDGLRATSSSLPVLDQGPKVAWVDLDDMLEKTVDSMVISHRHSISKVRRFSDHDVAQSPSRIHDTLQPTSFFDDVSTQVAVVLDIRMAPTWRVETDVAAWRRIFLNLIGNALKYTDYGLIHISLHMEESVNSHITNQPSMFVTFSVSDTGRGMSQKFLSHHLFTPFTQEDGLSVGTGLGMSIVKNIVQVMDGKINVRSEPGIGTKMKVTVPVHVDTNALIGMVSREPKPRICLLNFDANSISGATSTGNFSAESAALFALKSSIRSYAEHWMGLEVSSVSQPTEFAADIIVMPEGSLPQFYFADETGARFLRIPPGVSLVIISSKVATVDSVQHDNFDNRLVSMKQYCGPRRFKAAMDIALAADRFNELKIPLETLSSPLITPERIRPSFNNSTLEPLSVSSSLPGWNSHHTESTKEQTHGIDLLIVDDNEINRKILATYARKLSCSYAVANNGQDALSAYIQRDKQSGNRTSFKYILMDLSMPVMDGFTATRKIRDFEKGSRLEPTPIIALTGLSSAEAQREALFCGADLFLTKPLPLTKVKVLIEKGVEGLRDIS